MARISRSIAVLVALVFCIALLAGRSFGPTVEAQAKQAEKIEEARQETCVLVEAFVVEVNLPALYEQGISPIGRKPNSVSVGNILKCLGAKDIAQVTTGVKLALRSGVNGKAKITETTYVERKTTAGGGRNTAGPVVSTSFEDYDTGEQFEATGSIRPDGGILVDFEFSQSTYRNVASSDKAPANTANRLWSGTAYLDAGEPAIIGATQNEEIAVFLILCADVKGK